MSWLGDKLYGAIGRVLTKPRRQYQQVHPNNVAALRAVLRPADVVLVDGDQRVSEVIKYLTQSSWSHVALYVGDEPWRRNPERRAELQERFGDDAQHLLVEALMESGVVLSPISKYLSHNVRVCRPHGLSAEHAATVVNDVMTQLGARYDVENVLELARYLFPVSFVPRRFRRCALDAGSPLTSEVICSSLIARAFHAVGFPILPAVTPEPEEAAPPSRVLDVLPHRLLGRLLGRPAFYPATFRCEPPRLVTPRDFDLSPWFEIVKFNAISVGRFDYRRIRWAS